MRPVKYSSLVTTLSNHTSLLQGGLLEGEWGSLGWRPGRMINGSKDFIPGAGVWFRLSMDIADDCCMWDLRGHAYDVLVRFFPCMVYTNLNHRDTLEYKWPLAHCCHLIVWLIIFDGLEDGYGYYYHDYYCIYFICLNAACFMPLIVYKCKPNTWLIKKWTK
jgi:hypothetical protein